MSLSVVTGGSGFIGQHIVEQLVAGGEEVRIFDLVPPPTRRPGASFVRGSVTDRDALVSALTNARYVYHAAAIPHLWAPDPGIYYTVNVRGTEHVLDAALAAGVERVVHTSSSTVLTSRDVGYRGTTIDETFETLEKNLVGHYARSKWRGERLALGYADRLDVVVVMPTLPLGPGDRNQTPPTRMLADFVKGRNPAYVDCTLNIIDVRDVAAAHISACRRGRSGQRYILNQHSLPMATLLDQLQGIIERPVPRFRIPKAAALLASAADQAWSAMVTKEQPRAPLAGTRMSMLPITFSGQRAQSELGLAQTSLARTLADAVGWLSTKDDTAPVPINPALVFDHHRAL
ncbi:MAG: NAD-dependent epimerase/dehydratase family protein [Geminicoccaceae bacterium]